LCDRLTEGELFLSAITSERVAKTNWFLPSPSTVITMRWMDNKRIIMSAMMITVISTSFRPCRSFFIAGKTRQRFPSTSQSCRHPLVGITCFSSVSSQQQSHQRSEEKIKLRNTGGLRRLPVVKSPTELMNKAVKAPKRVKNDAYVFFCIVLFHHQLVYRLHQDPKLISSTF